MLNNGISTLEAQDLGGGQCKAFAELARGPGRPRIDDKRSPRGGFNDAEWAKVKAAAKADGMTASAWVRARCGL